MKLVVNLEVDSGWVDNPDFSPCYVFNNMRECYLFFSNIGMITIVNEPNPYDLYDFGEILLTTEDNSNFKFICMYAEEK